MPQHNIEHDPVEKELDILLTLAEQVTDLKRRVTHLETLGGGGDWVALDKTVLASAAATITFSSISGNFVALKIIANVRTDRAAVSDSIAMTFNNDTGANYYYLIGIVSHSGALATIQGLAANAIQMGEIAGDNAPLSAFSPLEIIIPSYAFTVLHKTVVGIASNRRANSSGNIVNSRTSGHWADTDAITEIDLVPGVGTNFKAGSSFYLFGLRV